MSHGADHVVAFGNEGGGGGEIALPAGGPCPTNPKIAPHTAPMITPATMMPTQAAPVLNIPTSIAMSSPNHAPVAPPASAARLFVIRPPIISTVITPWPTICRFSTGKPESDR